MADLVLSDEIKAKVAKMLQVWREKQAAMGEEFTAAQNARIADKDKKKEDDAYWTANIWTACNTDGVMDQANYNKMVGLWYAREDEIFGNHITWTEAEIKYQYETYCAMLGADQAKGLELIHFKSLKLPWLA